MDKRKRNVEVTYFAPYIKEVIDKLEIDKKRPAVHTYKATLNSFTKFIESSKENIPQQAEIMINKKNPIRPRQKTELSVN